MAWEATKVGRDDKKAGAKRLRCMLIDGESSPAVGPVQVMTYILYQNEDELTLAN